ncbi:MAG: hypothetical protein ACR2NP_13795 [Pirellulaceae bacterium]
MGQYHFAIPDSERFAEESMIAAQIVGLEGIPWPCKTNRDGQQLNVFRNTDVSGRLLVPVRTTGFGEIALTTGTLPEVNEAYLLDVELARGTLSRLRNQVSIWQEGGLDIDEDFQNRLDELVEKFGGCLFPSAVTPAERTDRCIEVIDDAVALMFEITQEFSRQIAEIHGARSSHVPVIAGTVCDGQLTDQESESCQSEMVIQKMVQPQASDNGDTSLDFQHTDALIDWIADAAEKSIRIAGPILQFDNTSLPDWMTETERFEERLDRAKQLCRNFGNLYQKRIKILHVTSGISGVGHEHFNYPQQLQMTLEMLEVLDQLMPNTSMMVSFDQPWGERLSMSPGGVQAMEIADALLRYGARLSAIGLEFNLDYWPQGTLMRDPLQWVDMVDRWSQFGLPLAIYLTLPTGESSDNGQSRFTQTIRHSTDESGYREYLSTIFRLLARRPSVNVVAWRRMVDSDNQRFPLSGLVDSAGQVKPVSQWFCDLLAGVKLETSNGPS